MDETITNYKETRWILADRQDEVKKKLLSMQRKAQKLGLPEPMMKFTGKKDIFPLPIYQDGKELEAKMPALKVEVEFSGSIPKVDGYQFLAKIDHSKGEDGRYRNLLNTAGQSSDEILGNLGTNFHECTPDCDHCEKPRARSTTYLVRNPDDGAVKQIGSTCVDDYIGSKTLKQVMAAFDMHAVFLDDDYFSEMDNDYIRGGATPNWFPIKTYLAMASYLTDTVGFAKSDSYDPKPTRQTLMEEISNPGSQNDSVLTKLGLKAFTPSLKDKVYDKVEDMIEHFKNSNQNSTYAQNIKSLLSSPYFEVSNRFACGILASVPSSYNREIERSRLMEPDVSENALNEPFGEEKSRGRLKLRLVNIREGQNSFGQTVQKYSFIDDHSRRFHWKASSYPDVEINIGQTYELTATIARHSEYKGHHYTHINRCNNFALSSPDAPIPDFSKKVKSKPVDKIKTGITMENNDGVVDGHSYFFIEREWKEGGNTQDLYLQFQFPLPSNDELQSKIIEGIANFVENYPEVERDHDKLHDKDASFVSTVLERTYPYRDLTSGLTMKLPGNFFLVERADIPPLEDLPKPFHEQRLGSEGGKVFTSFPEAEAAGRDMKQGRLLGFNMGQQKPLLIPLALSEKGHTKDDGNLSDVLKKSMEHGYTHAVSVDGAGQKMQDIPIGWDKPDFKENQIPLFVRTVNEPGSITRGNQSLDGERFILVVGLQDRDALSEINKIDPTFMMKLLDNNVLQDINGKNKKDFLGLTPASELLYELSMETKLNLREKMRYIAFTDPVTPDVVKMNGGDVIVVAISDVNNVDNCYQRSAEVDADFIIKADTLSPESIKKSVEHWVAEHPEIHNELKISVQNNTDEEQLRNAFKPQ